MDDILLGLSDSKKLLFDQNIKINYYTFYVFSSDIYFI